MTASSHWWAKFGHHDTPACGHRFDDELNCDFCHKPWITQQLDPTPCLKRTEVERVRYCICRWCKAEFVQYVSKETQRPQFYCNIKCANHAWKHKEVR